eukprot:TRINITY_DN70188_c0_g1_i1.p3 TRINITY_DN70188_c0_g1~~TRINITY_DN70188_c0_g1_i1.p3  ORF type:complete len:270 (+),score=60.16 TRINITY_DN70188_c0_g1_i1:77-886(+)
MQPAREECAPRGSGLCPAELATAALAAQGALLDSALAQSAGGLQCAACGRAFARTCSMRRHGCPGSAAAQRLLAAGTLVRPRGGVGKPRRALALSAAARAALAPAQGLALYRAAGRFRRALATHLAGRSAAGVAATSLMSELAAPGARLGWAAAAAACADAAAAGGCALRWAPLGAEPRVQRRRAHLDPVACSELLGQGPPAAPLGPGRRRLRAAVGRVLVVPAAGSGAGGAVSAPLDCRPLPGWPEQAAPRSGGPRKPPDKLMKSWVH